MIVEQPRVIIIDDKHGQPIGAQVKEILQWENRYRVDLVKGRLPDRTVGLDPRPALIIPVLPTSKEQAAELLARLGAKDADTSLLPVLRSEDLDEKLDDISLWTRDFLVLPLRATEVLARVRRLLLGNGEQDGARVRERVTETIGLTHLIGEDPAFMALKRKLSPVARNEAPVLLTGETGTGKCLCARALHYLSPRSRKPYLPVNCGAIPVELFESELFGHQKGAFTGAWAAQPGLVEEAEGGTLFLDEVESLSPGAQVKLLGFLEDHTYHSLGSSKPRHADVRIIAATNLELTQKIREGTFREDLFYRLAVMNLCLPPLRQRRADIPLLVDHFLAKFAASREERRRLSPRAMEALCHYAWPGNVRELENVIQQVVVLTDGRTIESEDLPIPLAPPLRESRGASLKETKAQVIEQFEKAYITDLLRVHQGNVTRAAEEAKKERRAFGRLIKKYHLDKR